MRTSIFTFFVLLIIGCNSSHDKTVAYSKSDLRKISWIEGSWQGMAGTTPFYEIYRFSNDTTIEITSYDWNGVDSSHSSKTFLKWNNDQYYLGDSLNYSVTQITPDSISMIPNYHANNSITWQAKDSNTWIAVLKGKKEEKKYVMKRANRF